MSIFDLFRKKQSAETFDIADVVQKMFDNAGIKPHRQNNMFMTEIDGVHCTFKTVLSCNKNELTIYAPFDIPVPKHVAAAVNLEVDRLNSESQTAKLFLSEDKDGYKIAAITDIKFDTVPEPSEVQRLMIHNIDLMDNEKFGSLASTIFGYASYNEVESLMLKNMTTAKGAEDTVSMSLSDGYTSILEQCADLNYSQASGRLIMLSQMIIRSKSPDKADDINLLSFKDLLQCAYSAADDIERDIMRKLAYLITTKDSSTFNEAEQMSGMIDASDMYEHYNKYFLINIHRKRKKETPQPVKSEPAKRIDNWDTLSREEKIKRFFENPEEIRDELAKELWGPEAEYRSEHNIFFPVGTSWYEIAEVIKKTHSSQWVYVTLTKEYFQPLPTDRELYPDDYAYWNWRNKVLTAEKPVMLSFKMFDDTRLICNVCTKDGGRGDSDGFGVEDSSWACMAININGTIEVPFRAGELWPRQGY